MIVKKQDLMQLIENAKKFNVWVPTDSKSKVIGMNAEDIAQAIFDGKIDFDLEATQEKVNLKLNSYEEQLLFIRYETFQQALKEIDTIYEKFNAFQEENASFVGTNELNYKFYSFLMENGFNITDKEQIDGDEYLINFYFGSTTGTFWVHDERGCRLDSSFEIWNDDVAICYGEYSKEDLTTEIESMKKRISKTNTKHSVQNAKQGPFDKICGTNEEMLQKQAYDIALREIIEVRLQLQDVNCQLENEIQRKQACSLESIVQLTKKSINSFATVREHCFEPQNKFPIEFNRGNVDFTLNWDAKNQIVYLEDEYLILGTEVTHDLGVEYGTWTREELMDAYEKYATLQSPNYPLYFYSSYEAYPNQGAEIDASMRIDFNRLEKYVENGMVTCFTSDDIDHSVVYSNVGWTCDAATMDWLNKNDGRSFQTIDDMKQCVGIYGMETDSSFYYINVDEALCVRKDIVELIGPYGESPYQLIPDVAAYENNESPIQFVAQNLSRMDDFFLFDVLIDYKNETLTIKYPDNLDHGQKPTSYFPTLKEQVSRMLEHRPQRIKERVMRHDKER